MGDSREDAPTPSLLFSLLASPKEISPGTRVAEARTDCYSTEMTNHIQSSASSDCWTLESLRPISPSSTLQPPSPPSSSKSISTERGTDDDAMSQAIHMTQGWADPSQQLSTSHAPPCGSPPQRGQSLRLQPRSEAPAPTWQDVPRCIALSAEARGQLMQASSLQPAPASDSTSQAQLPSHCQGFPHCGSLETGDCGSARQGPEYSLLQEASTGGSSRRYQLHYGRAVTGLPSAKTRSALLPRSSTVPHCAVSGSASPAEELAADASGYCSSSSDECEEVTRRLTAAFPGLPHRCSYERHKRWAPAKACGPAAPRLLSPSAHRPGDAGSLATLTPEEAQVLQDRRRRSTNHHLTGDAAVELFLRLKHAKQSFDFAKRQATAFSSLRLARMDAWQALDMLDELREYEAPLMSGGSAQQEPVSLSLREHALQTAELCRLAHPDKDWLHLVGLLHGLGKLLAHPAFGSQPQWAVCGESFPLGCAFDKGLEGSQFFSANPDRRRRIFSTPTGIYEPACGLQHVCMSWSAAEYMYLMLLVNKTALPKEALFVIRHQKFFSLTRPEGSTYQALLSSSDQALLPLLSSFQQLAAFKHQELPPGVALSPEAQRTYYTGLMHRYLGNKNLAW